MNRTALFFGSFNPVHNGHTAVARAVVGRGLCDELWFVVSPLNPLKDADSVADVHARLDMARLAAQGVKGAQVCDAELAMPRPSYTIDTLRRLSADHPGRSFAVVMGADSMEGIARWKDYREILTGYRIIVYPRSGHAVPEEFAGLVEVMGHVPMVDISSTEIRGALRECRDTDSMIDPAVRDYIVRRNLWGAGVCELMKNGAAHQRAGDNAAALNCFLRALELDPGHAEARQRADMLREIFEFAYRDIYNP